MTVGERSPAAGIVVDDAVDLTAVEEFARRHDGHDLPVAVRTYRALVPATPPGPGQQYGFAVDLDACSGCKSCVVACHNLNGLDEDETWRTVGLLRSRDGATPLQQSVTTACHHCVEPACLQGCPVDAYEKDPVTGIVAHLDDQCIGCGYCTWTCPYEVPRFNEKKGIVRKCDMCRGRLEEGQAPACVQACPSGAITIAIVDVSSARAEAATGSSLVPGAPPSSRTVPTTVYLTTKPAAADLVAADRDSIRPARAHPPLALMLVLTQVAVGAVLLDVALRRLPSLPEPLSERTALVGAVMGVLALAASVGHLGRPQYAFRAVLGFRHSWLSREVVAFGCFGPLAVLAAASRLSAGDVAGPLQPILAAGACVTGAAGVACSVMIYAVCGRRGWSWPSTAPRFALTTLGGGLWVTLSVAASGAFGFPTVKVLAVAASVVMTVKLLFDGAALLPRHADAEAVRRATLMRGELARLTTIRFVLGAMGAIAAPASVAAAAAVASPVAGVARVAGLCCMVAGELAERTLFFTAEVGPRMPGPRP